MLTYQDLLKLQNKLGGTIEKHQDGTYALRTNTGTYYNNGRKFFNGKLSNYDFNHILNEYASVKYVYPRKFYMTQLAKKLGKDARVVPSKADDGTFAVIQGDNKYFINNGVGKVKTPEGMRYYDINTGEIAYPTTQNPPKATSIQKKNSSKDSPLKQHTTKPAVSTQKTEPIVHTAVYTPTANALGVYTLGGWSTNEWGGGKKGVLDTSIASKLGLKEGATAKEAQDFLISKGYGITSDNYWGKQSQAALNDYLNRQNIKVSTVDTPTLQTERHNYSTYNPETKKYSYDSSFEITPQQLKAAGITNFQGYQNFMKNNSDPSNNIYVFFDRIKNQNQEVDFNNESAFNKFFNVKGRYGHRDRNRIITAAATSQASYDKISPTGTPLRTDFGKQYDALYNTLNEDQRDNIVWVQSGNTQIPIYQAPDGTYYKIGENGKLVNTGTYTLGQDGTYSVSFKKGGQIINSINKYQQGGNMANNKEIQEFQKYIVAEAQSQNKDPETYIKELGEDGLKEAYKRFQTYKKKQTQKAAHGAKLQYFKSLKNQCADDEELVYYKNGGTVDCGCVKKAQQGEKIAKPKNAVDAFKCGQKIKKNQQGKKFPLIETDKNGKNKTVYYNDEATRDSVAANKYNDQEVQTSKPGTYKKNSKGESKWTPDRTKAPYKVKKNQKGGTYPNYSSLPRSTKQVLNSLYQKQSDDLKYQMRNGYSFQPTSVKNELDEAYQQSLGNIPTTNTLNQQIQNEENAKFNQRVYNELSPTYNLKNGSYWKNLKLNNNVLKQQIEQEAREKARQEIINEIKSGTFKLPQF